MIFRLFFLLSALSIVSLNAFSLDEAIETTLEKNMNIELKKESVNYTEGNYIQNKGIFDPKISATVSKKLEKTPNSVLQSSKSETRNDTNEYKLGVEKYFESGLRVGSGISQQDKFSEDLPTVNSGSVYLDIKYPLLKKNSKEIVTGNLEASKLRYEAEKNRYKREIETAILETTKAYWQYLRATKRANLYEDAKDRSQLLYENIKKLVNADLKPKSDLKLAKADIVKNDIEILKSKEEIEDAKNLLSQSMGIDVEDSFALSFPSDSFYDLESSFAEDIIYQNNTEQYKELIESRFDIKAIELEIDIQSIELALAKDDLNDNLDMNLNFSYSNQNKDDYSILTLMAPKDREGNKVELSLSYEFAIDKNAQNGKYVSALSSYSKSRISYKKAKQDAYYQLSKHLENMKKTIEIYKSLKESVALREEVFENEKKKYSKGLSTIFDIVESEDKLNIYQKELIDIAYRFAIQVAELNYYKGTLMTDNKDGYMKLSSMRMANGK